MAYLRRTLNPGGITAIIDTREQCPLPLEKYGLRVIRKTLMRAADYSLAVPNLESVVRIERKRLGEFASFCSWERDRAEAEISTFRGYAVKAIVCEFSFQQVLNHEYRNRVHPNAVMASISSWMLEGIPFLMAETHEGAAWMVADLLKRTAKKYMSLAIDACSCMLGEEVEEVKEALETQHFEKAIK